MSTYTDKQYALIEALLNAATCSEVDAESAMVAAEDLAVTMSPEDVLLCQSAMLRIIRRQPD
jgi:pyruvate kinase